MPSHFEHTRLVASLYRDRPPAVKPSTIAPKWVEGETFELRSPYDGYRVAVRFTTHPSCDDVIWVRGTNWSAEHEPNIVVRRGEAQALYRRLLDAGFIKHST